MKICIIGNDWKQQFPLLGYGGIESAVEHLCYGLSNNFKEIKFTAIVPKIIQKNKTYNFNIIETSYIESSISGIHPKLFAYESMQIIRNSPIKPDIIWCYGSWAPESLLELNIPIICTIMDSGGWEDNKFIYNQNLYYRFSSEFIYNEVFKNTQYNTYKENIKNQSFWIHTGMCSEAFIEPIDNRENYILWVAGLNWGMTSKGLDMFIVLSKMLPNEKFKAYGSGNKDLENVLTNISAGLDNFDFCGELKRGEAHNKVFSNAKLFAMFTKIPEAFGRTIVESLTKGTPVIGTKYGAVPELVNDSDLGFCSNDLNEIYNYIKTNKNINHRLCFEKSKKYHVSSEIVAMLDKTNNILSAL